MEIQIDGLAAVLRGERVPWSALRMEQGQLLDTCAAQGLIGLLHHRLTLTPAHDDWPPAVRDDLRRAARAIAARELLRYREIVAALEALADAGVHPILVKGTALAYSVYAEPMARPRVDTDFLIRHGQIGAARRALTACGYTAPLQCDGEHLFRQFVLSKTDDFGVDHAFDVHWKISTQAMFANLLSYDELAAEAVAVKPLGPHARAAGSVHALLLACVHPAMHHRNVEWPLWVYDVHLLASRLSDDEIDRFAHMATAKQVAAIAGHELARARARFGTPVPERVIARLAAPVAEASAAYLHAGRRWHHELASSVRALPGWRDRLGLLRDVLVPSPRYMFALYGLRATRVGAILLPALYLRRGLRGMWKVLTRRK